jgi:hypothetical protein
LLGHRHSSWGAGIAHCVHSLDQVLARALELWS